MADIFFGDKNALKNIQIPIDFDEWLDGLKAKAAGVAATDSAWYRAVVNKRATAVVSIPRRIARGGEEIEPEVLPFRVDFGDLMQRGSMALDNYGAFYAAVVQNARRQPLEVRWLDPRTIRLNYDKASGRLLSFDRLINGRVAQSYPYDEKTRLAPGLIWAWTPGMNETGPGDTLAETARLPASMLVMADALLKGLYERGAINQHFVTANYQPPEAEKERLREKLRRAFFGGVREAHSIEVFSDGLTISKIGTDPNALELGPTAERIQNDICAAADTPRILLLGTDANRATVDRITQTWLMGPIQMHAQRMVDAFNHHLLEPAGYTMTLNTAGMDVDQQEEAEKAAAWATYVDRGVNPATAAEMLGIDIPEDMPFVEGPSRAEMQAQALAAQAAMQNQPRPEGDDAAAGRARREEEVKRLHAFIDNRTYLTRPFKSDILTPAEIEAAIMVEEWQDYP